MRLNEVMNPLLWCLHCARHTFTLDTTILIVLGKLQNRKSPLLSPPSSSYSFIANPIPSHKHLFFCLTVLPNPRSESLFIDE